MCDFFLFFCRRFVHTLHTILIMKAMLVQRLLQSFALYHEWRMTQRQVTLPVRWTISRILRTFSPQSSKVGTFLTHPHPFREKTPFPGMKKPDRDEPYPPNDIIPSLLPMKRSIFVYTAPSSDASFVYTCKKSHPRLVSKLGWFYGKARWF